MTHVNFFTIGGHVSPRFLFLASSLLIIITLPYLFITANIDLAGWQLDKLAETANKQAGDQSESDSDDEDVPFACLICRKHYTDPIVTRCGHYFCSACAIKRFAKTPKCLACGAPTGGIFNRADKIIEKVNKKRQEKEEKDDDEHGTSQGGVEIEGLDNEASE